jgi:hypothetical protein
MTRTEVEISSALTSSGRALPQAGANPGTGRRSFQEVSR